MNVLSLFDGMSCGQIALKELGIIPDIYYASEIDKHAIAQTQLNFPDTIQLWSVTDVDVSKLERIDLLIGGSPCQSFSFAGKRKGMSTKCNEEIYTLDRYLQLKSDGFEFEGQSYLFWEYMRILTEIRKYNPNVLFLLENVEMGAKWERVLSEAIGLYGVHINSALVSAQNRKRIYWTNIRTRQEGLFGELYSDIPQPEDRGILLRDILEIDVDEKYYLSDKMLNYFDKRAANFNAGKVNVRDVEGKATTITASCKSVDISDNFICVDNNGREDPEKTGTLTQRYASGPSNFGSDPFIKVGKNLKPKANQEKASCFTAGAHSGGNHSDMDLIGVAKDNLVIQLNQSKESGCKQPYQQNRVYDSNGIFPSLMTEYLGNVIENHKIRRLTPTECARLQTVPDWYKWNCSDTQQYRMLGNGWTVEVIKHIFSYLTKFKNN